jgi:hypothetical protein
MQMSFVYIQEEADVPKNEQSSYGLCETKDEQCGSGKVYTDN